MFQLINPFKEENDKWMLEYFLLRVGLYRYNEYINISNSNTLLNILQYYHYKYKGRRWRITRHGEIIIGIGKLGLSFQFGARNAQQEAN